MFKREIKVNFKSFLIWTILLVGMFFLIFLIYPSMFSDSEEAILDMMNMFPQEVLKAFNMDISSINTPYGWLKSEGMVFVLLIIGCYAGTLGGTILLKEESDKTIEYLNSLPVKRTNIVLSKFFVGLIYITLIVVLLGLFNYIGICLSEENIDIKQFTLLSLTPLLPSYVIFIVCMFIATFTNKTRKMLGVSLGIVFISYIFNTISAISDNVEYLKYFSIFTLADTRNVIIKVTINPAMVVLSLIITSIFLTFTIIRYNKKELI